MRSSGALLSTLAVGAAAAIGCQQPAGPHEGRGDLISAVRATERTTAETGIHGWEMYTAGDKKSVLGLSQRGDVLFEQVVTSTVTNGEKTVEVRVLRPASAHFRMRERSGLETFIAAQDAKLLAILPNMERDLRSTQTERAAGVQYGPCLDCAYYTTTCVAATAACATCPTNGIGCFACPAMVAHCFSAGWHCACCASGATSC